MATGADIATHVLTGFLGSGKTTLLNRLLGAGAFADTAVVVNELGEIALDHLLVTERADQIAVLEGGCLCCAVIDSLPETLLELCRKRAAGELPAFQRIVIETTGLADPGPIVEVLRRSPLLSYFLAPGLVVAALDMVSAAEVISRHPEALRQLVMADRIVLTKLDLCTVEAPAAEAWLRVINPLAAILTTADVAQSPGLLLAHASRGPATTDTHSHAHHSHGVRAWSFPIEAEVTQAGLAAFASAVELRLGPALLRCKGLVRTRRGDILIQGVGTRFSFTPAPALAGPATPHVTCIVQNREREELADLLAWLHVPEGTLPPTPQDIA